MGSGMFGGIMFGEYAQLGAFGNPPLTEIAGTYEPLLSIAGAYEPLQTVAGSDESTITLEGEWE